MFRNLEAELTRMNLKKHELAVLVGISQGTLSAKLNGRFPFTLDEARKIRQVLSLEFTIDYLFETQNTA